MSEYETAMLGRRWCPGCDPSADPTREILDTVYCEAHRPAATGSADPDPDGIYISGSMEAESAVCRPFADLIHRGGSRS